MNEPFVLGRPAGSVLTAEQVQRQKSFKALDLTYIPGEYIWLDAKSAMTVWPEVKDRIQAVIDLNELDSSLEHYRSSLQKDLQRMWLFMGNGEIDALAITSILSHSNGKKSMNIDLIQGENFDVWADAFMRCVEVLAKHNDCKEIVALGGSSWRKTAKALGFEEKIITYRKRVKS